MSTPFKEKNNATLEELSPSVLSGSVLSNSGLAGRDLLKDSPKLTTIPKIVKVEEEQDYLPAFSNEATRAISSVGKLKYKEGTIGIFELNVDGITFEYKVNALPVRLKKLLSFSTTVLTSTNSKGSKDVNARVNIDLREFFAKCGYKVLPIIKDGMSEEEVKKEKSRAENNYKDINRKINRDLVELLNLKVSGFIKDSRGDKIKINLNPVIDCAYKRGYASIGFHNDYVRLLVNSPITQFPIALLRLSDNNPNAFAIGEKLAYNASIDNNVRRGQDRKISIKNLLKVFSDIDIRRAEESRQYRQRIINPFFKVIEDLCAVGYLHDYKLLDKKGNPFLDQTLANVSYRDFVEGYLYYVPENDYMHSEEQQKRLNAPKGKRLEKSERKKKS